MIDSINKALTLKDFNQQFEAYRTSRKKMTKFLDKLWQQAVSLFNHHSISEVARTLRVSNQQIKTQLDRINVKDKEAVDFVSLNHNDAIQDESFAIDFKADDTLTTKVEITRPDGAQLVISQLPESSLTKLLNRIIGGL